MRQRPLQANAGRAGGLALAAWGPAAAHVQAPGENKHSHPPGSRHLQALGAVSNASSRRQWTDRAEGEGGVRATEGGVSPQSPSPSIPCPPLGPHPFFGPRRAAPASAGGRAPGSWPAHPGAPKASLSLRRSRAGRAGSPHLQRKLLLETGSLMLRREEQLGAVCVCACARACARVSAVRAQGRAGQEALQECFGANASFSALDLNLQP